MVKISESDLHERLAAASAIPLRRVLERAGPGQRLRVTSLPQPVMVALCRDLAEEARWVVRLLTSGKPQEPWDATPTKVVELRNSEARPMLLFIPPDLRTAAEDSFGVATFVELPLDEVGSGMISSLMSDLEPELRRKIEDALGFLRRQGILKSRDEEAEYLLTTLKNGATARAAGGALFVFGLVPDYNAFDRDNPLTRLSYNEKVRLILSDIRQPLQSRIARLPIEPRTIQQRLFSFLRERHADDVKSWAAALACDEGYEDLTFDRWPLIGAGEEGELRLVVEDLVLPKQEEDLVGGSIPMPVLDLQGREGIKVSFRSIPPHGQVPRWATYRFQLVALGGEEPVVAWESSAFRKPPGRQRTVSRTLKVQDFQDLEEGTYFLRVDAYDSGGVLLSVSRRLDPADPGSRYENETEPFLVVRGATEVERPAPRSINVPTLLDAWATLAGSKEPRSESVPALEHITGAWAESMTEAPRGDAHFHLTTPGLTEYVVAVPGILRRVEAELLSEGSSRSYRLDLSRGQDLADAGLEPVPGNDLPVVPVVEAFCDIRESLFRELRNQHATRSGRPAEERVATGLVETADLLALEPLIRAYGSAFEAAAKWACGSSIADAPSRLATARALSQLDLIELAWRDPAGGPARALLVAPTHPVRMLWHLQHARLLLSAISGPRRVPDWGAFLQEARRTLVPLNLPPVLFDRRDRGYAERGPLTSCWSLYLPDRHGDNPVDRASLDAKVKALLGIRKRVPMAATVSGHDLGSRVLDYLAQHPYVEQLRLNVFNPGDGQLIADLLRDLEARRLSLGGASGAPPLRYSVQMFGPGSEVETLGEAVEALLDPDRQVAEEDEFASGPLDHLRPKLVFSRGLIDDFLRNPDAFEAHLSIVIEQFGLKAHLARATDLRRGGYVAGLIQEPDTEVKVAGGAWSFTRALRPSTSKSPDAVEALLSGALGELQRLQVVALTGAPAAEDVAPAVVVACAGAALALVRQVHERSDWVLTVDRNLGLELFDSPRSGEDLGFLLDFAPEYLHEDRQRLLLTTRVDDEVAALVRPAIDRFALNRLDGDELLILETLRSLSGRLALRLLAAPTQESEVVALLLARWLLEQADLLSDRVIIPLDAHRSWFSGLPSGEAPGRPFRRADLLLVELDPEKRVLDLAIVEVKLRSDLAPSARSALYREMAEQTAVTETAFRRLFDPHLYQEERTDGLLRAKELGTALRFYLRRAMRYGLMADDVANEAMAFVEDLESGYRLQVRRLGVLFHLQAEGSHVDEEEPSFPVHRFGLDVARRLLETARRDFKAGAHPREEDGPPSGPPAGPEPGPSNPTPGGGELDSIRSAVSTGARQRLGGRRAGALGSIATPTPPPAAVESGSEREVESSSETPPPAIPPEAPEPAGNTAYGLEGPLKSDVCEPVGAATLRPDVLLGANSATSQFGLLGKSGSSTVAIDLTGCNTVSLFGVQGFGTSYTLGDIAEMASTQALGINVLPAPLATVIFHYHKSDAYPPEFAAAAAPNQKTSEVERLLREYGATPHGVPDIVLLAPEAKVADRRREYPGMNVQPIKFSSGELGAESWKFLLGAYGNEALYVRLLVAIMRRHRQGLTLERFRQEILDAHLSPALQRLAEDRLSLAAPYIDDASRLGSVLRPGRTVIVDLRDEWIEKDEALGLFVVMLQIFATTRVEGRDFNKLVVFDEAHKYITESDLIGQVVETIREMRHQATSVVIASQDPLSVPRAVIELSSILMLHRMTSPQWLKHLRTAISAMDEVTDAQVAGLGPGEALIWAQRSTEKRFTMRPQKVTIRPRFSQHGGGTRTAISGETVR